MLLTTSESAQDPRLNRGSTHEANLRSKGVRSEDPNVLHKQNGTNRAKDNPNKIMLAIDRVLICVTSTHFILLPISRQPFVVPAAAPVGTY